MKIEHWCTLIVCLFIAAFIVALIWAGIKKIEKGLISLYCWIRRIPQVENKKQILVPLETPAPKYNKLCNQIIWNT